MKQNLSDNAICPSCNSEKRLTEFHKNKASKNGHATYCKICAVRKSRKHHAKRMATDPSYRRSKKDSYIKYSHGISLEEYERRLSEQNGCAICGTTSPKGGWHLDHDHTTGKRRKFLCNPCNRGIGYLQDDVEILKKAINYLNEHSKEGTGQ